MTGKKGKAKPNWKITLLFSQKTKAKIVQDWLVEECGTPRSMIPIEEAAQDGWEKVK